MGTLSWSEEKRRESRTGLAGAGHRAGESGWCAAALVTTASNVLSVVAWGSET